jgi:hypothetical protein
MLFYEAFSPATALRSQDDESMPKRRHGLVALKVRPYPFLFIIYISTYIEQKCTIYKYIENVLWSGGI